MDKFQITQDNQSVVNDAVMQLMDVFDEEYTYNEFMKALFDGVCEITKRIYFQHDSTLTGDTMYMLNALQKLTSGLDKLGKLSMEVA